MTDAGASPLIPRSLRSWSGVVAFAVLTIQPLVFYRDVLFSKSLHIPYDIEEFHQPLTAFIARCVREHIWPYWDPFTYCGTSMWADIQAQLFYPFTWIALLLGNLSEGRKLFYWMELLVPLHMVIGGVFAYAFTRRLRCSVPVALFAATTYQLGAFFASQAQHLGAVAAAAWFPLILLCVVRLAEGVEPRWIGLTALAVALVILAGFPPATDVILISAVMFAVGWYTFAGYRWRVVLALAGAFCLGILISSVQLIPTLQAYGLTIAKFRADWNVTGGGLPVQSLASFLWPNYYHEFTPSDATLYRLKFNFTNMYTYCGHLAVFFVALASILLIRRPFDKSTRVLWISFVLAVISAVWMIGDATPVYVSIYTHLPRILRGSLYANYALIPFSFWVGVTAALSLRELPFRNYSRLSWVIALAAGANLIAVSANRPMNTGAGSYKTRNSDYVLDGNAEPVRKIQGLVRSSFPPLRIDSLGPDYWAVSSGGDLYQIPSASGDNPLLNLRYYYFRLAFSGDFYWDRQQYLTSVTSPWIDALNDGFIMMADGGPGRFLPADHFEKADFYGLWKNKRPLPRFYLVDRVLHASNMDEARTLLGKVTDPSTEAIVENLSSDWRGSGRAGGSVRTVEYTNNRIELEIRTADPSFLVTSEAFYPGWTATINGTPVDLLPTNLAFRGLPVQAGESRVIMTFRPQYLHPSAVLSILGLLTCIGLVSSSSVAPKSV